MASLFFFDKDNLLAHADRHRDAYRSADPFPHVVIDDFLPPDVLDGILEEFPGRDDIEWKQFKNRNELKLANNQDDAMGPRVRHLLSQFNSSAICGFLEDLTGIDGIIPDPYFFGGGQHQIERGGYLKVHADFNKHLKMRLDRRINLLLYLNKDWEADYGGYLELWDRTMTRPVQKILPIFNRCVIFNTTSDSFHGHPEPLTCPEDRTRKSLALYYYTQGRPEEEKQVFHSTLFRDRPGEDLGEKRAGSSAKELIRKLTPPLIWDGLRSLSGRGKP